MTLVTMSWFLLALNTRVNRNDVDDDYEIAHVFLCVRWFVCVRVWWCVIGKA